MSWEPPADEQINGIIVLYIIRVVPVSGGATLYYNSSVPRVTLTSLRPYTVYQCYIAAETSAGRGPFSSALTVETDEAGMHKIETFILTSNILCHILSMIYS